MRRSQSYNKTQKNELSNQNKTKKFQLRKFTLGKGNFSEVKLAIHSKTKQQVAAKVIDLLEWNKEYKNEISVLQKLTHKSIIQLVDSERCLDGRGVIYLEYQPYPTLGSYISKISPLSEPLAVRVLQYLVEAVLYLHSLGISHHDIKPENILFNPKEQTIKLFDFGLAVIVDPLRPISSSNGGSPLYMAPEVLQKPRHNVFISDVWSLGLVLYESLTGKSPFHYCESLKDLQKEWSHKRDISLPQNMASSHLRMLYCQMVKYKPEKRISIMDLKKILEPLLMKNCLGLSLGGNGHKKNAQRTSSVDAVIRTYNRPKEEEVEIIPEEKEDEFLYV
jgi:serine/threonine protein kinase